MSGRSCGHKLHGQAPFDGADRPVRRAGVRPPSKREEGRGSRDYAPRKSRYLHKQSGSAKWVKSRARGYPPGGQKIEVEAKMAQDASKSGFGEGLEASWRRLGAPKRGPRGTQIDVGRVFF